VLVIGEIAMQMTHESVDAELAKLLRDKPRGTTAGLTDFAVAYWNGERVVYTFLHEDGHGAPDDEFDLTDYALELWHDEFAAWFAAPHFTEARPEVLEWIKAALPSSTSS
jgi:hypothetical protein